MSLSLARSLTIYSPITEVLLDTSSASGQSMKQASLPWKKQGNLVEWCRGYRFDLPAWQCHHVEMRNSPQDLSQPGAMVEPAHGTHDCLLTSNS